MAAAVEDVESWVAIVDGLSFAGPTPERMISVVAKLSDDVRERVAGNISAWMERISKHLSLSSDFLAAWDSLLEVATVSSGMNAGDFFTSAVNSTIGQLTLALLNCWLAKCPKRESGLQPEFRERLDDLLGRPDPQSQLARPIVAAHLYSLHLVDRPWAQLKLIPLFAWSNRSARKCGRGTLASWSIKMGYAIILSCATVLMMAPNPTMAVFHWQRAECHLIEDREDGRVYPNAKRQRDDSRGRE